MSVTFHKNLADISEDDIASLITNQVRENLNLEYKEVMYGSGDEDTREMLRDITSIANAQGGHILVGIKEDEQNEGIPIGFEGIEDAEMTSSRITSSCLSNIDERIPGLQTHLVPLNNGKHIIVIRIPKSPRAPHIITFKGLYQFWKRHDRQKSRMSVAEIKEACNATEQLMIRMEQFLEKRKEMVLKKISGKPLYFISATPYFLGDDIIDIYDLKIRDFIKNPPDQRVGGKNVQCSSIVTPNLYGVISKKPGYKSLKLFRNGHSEFMVNIDNAYSGFICDYVEPESKKTPILRPLHVVEYIVSFLRFYKKVYEYLSIVEPVVVSLNFFNIKGYGLYRFTSKIEDFGETNIWHDEHLEIPPQTILSFESPDKIAKIFADRIWNALNYERAPYFDAYDNFVPTNL